MQKTIAIIPARYASTRFPGKPLAKIGNKPMIQHVYERVMGCGFISKVVVATDDQRIQQAVTSFGGEVIMTSSEHQSGTDRCLEAYGKTGEEYDIILNVQGDEPFIREEQLKILLDLFKSKSVEIATLAKALSPDAANDKNKVKVVFDKNGKALYFSRSKIPWGEQNSYWKHLGIYAYRSNILPKIAALDVSRLEKSEKLEQLRWLENGYTIHVGQTAFESIAVDTPEDLEQANAFLKNMR